MHKLAIDGHRIDKTGHTKFLGVIIDYKLNWKKHISYIIGKIAKWIGVITNARKLLDKEILVTLYYTFIYPYLYICVTAIMSGVTRLDYIWKIVFNAEENCPNYSWC